MWDTFRNENLVDVWAKRDLDPTENIQRYMMDGCGLQVQVDLIIARKLYSPEHQKATVNYFGFVLSLSAYYWSHAYWISSNDLTASELHSFGSQKLLPALFRSWETKQKTRIFFPNKHTQVKRFEININYGTLFGSSTWTHSAQLVDVMELIFLFSISFVCVMRSKIQLPAWNKLFSKPLFVLFECGILLSALQASLNLHQHYFWRPE